MRFLRNEKAFTLIEMMIISNMQKGKERYGGAHKG